MSIVYKAIITLCLSIFSLNSNAQVLISLLFGDKLNSPGLEFGLEGGMNFSSIQGMNSTSYSRAINLGFYFDIRLKESLDLYTGVLVRSRQGINKLKTDDLISLGAEVYSESGDYKQVLNTFLVPALIKYKFPNHFYIEAGPQFGLTTKAWIEFESENDGITARIREDNIDDIYKFDIGASGGLGYKLMKGTGITIGIKYYYGFLDVYKERSGTNNHGLYLKLNIPVGAAKAKNKNEL